MFQGFGDRNQFGMFATFSKVICSERSTSAFMGESSFSKDNAAYVGNTTGTAQEPFVVKGLPVGGVGQGYVTTRYAKVKWRLKLKQWLGQRWGDRGMFNNTGLGYEFLNPPFWYENPKNQSISR